MNTIKVLKNLQIKEKQKVLLLNVPEWFSEAFGEYDYDLEPISNEYDFIVAFAYNSEELNELVSSSYTAGIYDCTFWVAYPKLSGAIKSDLKREVLFDIVSDHGLRPVRQISIDQTWSGMRIRPIEAVGK